MKKKTHTQSKAPTQEELDLNAKICTNLQQGFDDLTLYYRSDLCRFVARELAGTRSAHLAEDIVQEALFSVYKLLCKPEYRKRLKGAFYLRRYLYTASLNEMSRMLRNPKIALTESLDYKVEIQGEQDFSDEQKDPEQLMIEREKHQQNTEIVNFLFQKLSPNHYQLVKRRFFSNEETLPTYEQIGKETNKPLGTIKSEFSRAHSRMRHLLKENKFPDSYES